MLLKGTRVQALIFGTDIELFANTLKILHKYYISNAVVTPVEPIHELGCTTIGGLLTKEP